MRSPTLGMIPNLIDQFDNEFSLEMFRRANYSRHFEFKVKETADKGCFKIPIYLAVGTEFNSAALSMVLNGYNIFAQHRGMLCISILGGHLKDCEMNY